jgi:hypothetical protein
MQSPWRLPVASKRRGPSSGEEISPVGVLGSLVRFLWRFKILPMALGSAAWLAAVIS